MPVNLLPTPGMKPPAQADPLSTFAEMAMKIQQTKRQEAQQQFQSAIEVFKATGYADEKAIKQAGKTLFPNVDMTGMVEHFAERGTAMKKEQATAQQTAEAELTQKTAAASSAESKAGVDKLIADLAAGKVSEDQLPMARMRLIQAGAITPTKQDEFAATLKQAGIEKGTPQYEQATMSMLRADAHMEQPHETITRKLTAATSLVDKGIATDLASAQKMVDSIETTGKIPEGVREGMSRTQLENSYTMLNMAIQTHDPKALAKWAASMAGTPLEGLVDPTKQPIEWEKLDEMKKQTKIEQGRVDMEKLHYDNELKAAQIRAGVDLKKEENAKVRAAFQDLYTAKKNNQPVPPGLEEQVMDYFAEAMALPGQTVEKFAKPTWGGFGTPVMDYIYHDLVNSQALSDIEDASKMKKPQPEKPATPAEIQGLLQQNIRDARVGGGLR